jgi:hypothetical protein
MEDRFPREAERLLAFLFFLSSSEELLEEEPVRAGTTTSPVGATPVSSSVDLCATSVLFLGVEPVAGAASVAGLP